MSSVLVFMPHARDVKPQTVSCIMNMMMHIVSGKAGIERVQFFNAPNCSNICKARKMAVEKAIEWGFSHLMMIDDDMVFPVQTVETLLSHGKDVVICNYITKSQQHPRWTANTEQGGLDSNAAEPLMQVRGGGMGICLIRIDAVKDLPRPWFEVREDEERYTTEDFNFFLKCRENGVEVWCDNDLSRDIYHVGDFLYSGFRTVPDNQLAGE